MSKRVTYDEAFERVAAAINALGDWPAGGFYANTLETAMLSLATLQVAMISKAEADGPPKSFTPPPRHVLHFNLTDEELTGLRALMRASKTSLDEADFAQFVIREHLYRKGFHP